MMLFVVTGINMHKGGYAAVNVVIALVISFAILGTFVLVVNFLHKRHQLLLSSTGGAHEWRLYFNMKPMPVRNTAVV